MDSNDKELRELRVLIAQLTERVFRLEQGLGVATTPSEVPIEAPPLEAAAPSAPLVPPPIQVERPGRLHIPHIRPAASGPDLESRIGSQWLNRIGIIAVLIGVSFFLKYAFENNWIGPGGRISVGLIAGIAVVLWSERFRKAGHTVFSWSLKAIGIGTLYLSLWAGFQLYHLFPPEIAFLCMVIVTAATGVLAITQEAEILAAFALMGGFATPMLLSTGQNREVVLFSYVALLDLATLVLVAVRLWRRLLSGAFLGTVILYVGWYVYFYSRVQLDTTLAFATVFFGIFAVAPLFAKGKIATELTSVSRTMILLPLFNAALYFLAVYAMLEDVSQTATAWIAVVLAAVYLLLGREIRTRFADDASRQLLTLLHVALAVGFLTTAIPLKLETFWITIGWLIESAVLLWIAYRTSSNFLKVLSLIALVLGIGRLIIFDNFQPVHLIFNARFFIYLVAIAVVAFALNLARKSTVEGERQGAAVGVVVINVLALIALNLEAHDYFVRQISALDQLRRAHGYDYLVYRNIYIARDFTYSAIWMTYGAALMWIGFWKRSAFLRWQALVLLAVTIVKVFTFDTSQLERGYRIISFIALGVLLMAVSFIYQRDWLKLSGARRGPPDNAKGNSAPA